jgi:hypothetical protein
MPHRRVPRILSPSSEFAGIRSMKQQVPSRPLVQSPRSKVQSQECEALIFDLGRQDLPLGFFSVFFSILAHVSRSVTVRLKTGAPGFESFESAQK